MNRIENGIQDTFTGQVTGAPMSTHRALGPVFLESVYRNALACEFRAVVPEVKAEVAIPVFSCGEQVGDFFTDLVAQGPIINWKAIHELHPAYEAQPANPVKNCSSIRAFTLLELLVALVVLSILIVMMMGLVSSATALWRQSENRAEAYREARAAMGIIARDLQNTVVSTNTNLFRMNGDAFGQLGGSDVFTDSSRASALFFHAAMPASAQDPDASKSDVCQVGYFVAFAKTALSANLPGSQPSLNLYRYFLSSDHTFSNLKATPGNNPFTNNIVPINSDVELLARNIREFRVTPYVYTNGTLTTNFSASTNKPVPDLVEISITAVNQEAARRFTDRADWIAASAPAGLTNAQQTFTTRIHLNQPAQ